MQNHEPYQRIASYFPLHDNKFNSRWLNQWAKVQLFIPDSQLSEIRDHFGDGVALYFEFLRYYFRALAFPAFVGLSAWLGGHYFSRLYSFCLVVWSIVFVESWKIRERKLSVRWGTMGISHDTADLRPGFKPEEIITSPITGQKVAHSPWWKREGRMLAGVPALFGFAAGLSILICCIFSAEGRHRIPNVHSLTADSIFDSHHWGGLQWSGQAVYIPAAPRRLRRSRASGSRALA